MFEAEEEEEEKHQSKLLHELPDTFALNDCFFLVSVQCEYSDCQSKKWESLPTRVSNCCVHMLCK